MCARGQRPRDWVAEIDLCQVGLGESEALHLSFKKLCARQACLMELRVLEGRVERSKRDPVNWAQTKDTFWRFAVRKSEFLKDTLLKVAPGSCVRTNSVWSRIA